MASVSFVTRTFGHVFWSKCAMNATMEAIKAAAWSAVGRVWAVTLKLIIDAYYCRECVQQEKDRDGCPKIVNLGSAKTDLFYERKKYGFKKRWNNPNSV